MDCSTEFAEYEIFMHTIAPAGEVISPLSSQKDAVFLQKSNKERVWWVP